MWELDLLVPFLSMMFLLNLYKKHGYYDHPAPAMDPIQAHHDPETARAQAVAAAAHAFGKVNSVQVSNAAIGTEGVPETKEVPKGMKHSKRISFSFNVLIFIYRPGGPHGSH